MLAKNKDVLNSTRNSRFYLSGHLLHRISMFSSLGKVKGRNYFQIFPFSFFFLSLLPKPPAAPAPLTMQSFRISLGVSLISSHQPSPQPLPLPGHVLHIHRKKLVFQLNTLHICTRFNTYIPPSSFLTVKKSSNKSSHF